VEPTDDNLRAWEEAHRRGSPEPKTGLPDAVRERLPALEGKHVLQLGGGPAWAAELAGLGALVTAVEPATEGIAEGHERAPTAAWIQADVHTLPLELLRGRFHLVLADATPVRDADAWAAGVEAALRIGGYVLLHGAHPVAACLDPLQRWRGDYFDRDTPTPGELVTALAQAGLVLRRVEELPPPGPARRPPTFPATFAVVAARTGS
jgi:hypothetical protein